jgi:hypothetical protein
MAQESSEDFKKSCRSLKFSNAQNTTPSLLVVSTTLSITDKRVTQYIRHNKLITVVIAHRSLCKGKIPKTKTHIAVQPARKEN